MEMYIANTTKQHHDFVARIPEYNQPYNQRIAAGAQIVLKNLTKAQIDTVVAQHERYGMRHVKDVDRKTYVGLLYNTDRPVDAGQIEEGLNDNDQALTDKASDMRATGIAAANEQLAEQARENGGEAGSVSVEIVEQKNPNDPGSTPGFTQRIEVDTTTQAAIQAGKNGKRK